MKFLFAIFTVTVLATLEAMKPESADRFEIRLVEVVNNTQEPITMHAENGDATLLSAGKALELNRAMVLLTQEELLKMKPWVVKQVKGGGETVDDDEKFQIKMLTEKNSKTWQYDEIIKARQEQETEQLALTTKEKQSYTPSNKPLSLRYGNSSFYSKFLHFTNRDPVDQSAENRIWFTLSACIDQNERGHVNVSLAHNGNTSFNPQMTTRYTKPFFGKLCTSFRIFLHGANLECSHIEHNSMPSLYDLCLKSCLQNNTKEKLETLVNPQSPVAPTIKSHILAYLSFHNNTSRDKGQ